MPRINLLLGVPTRQQRDARTRRRLLKTIRDAAWEWNYTQSDESPLPEVVLQGEHVLHLDGNGFVMEDQRADQEVNDQHERIMEMHREAELEFARFWRSKPTDPESIESVALAADSRNDSAQVNSRQRSNVGYLRYIDDES